MPVNFNRVIFNDGAGNQTDDLIRNSDGWFDGTQWYDSEPNLDDSRMVTFSVDMSVQAELGKFDITLDDMVYVRGDFNEFSLDNPMTLVGDDVYEAEIEIFGPAGSEREYKFFIVAGDERELPNGGWELLNDDPGLNRSFLLGEEDVDQTLPVVFFNDDDGEAPEPESRLVTFSVDMSVQAELGNFDNTLDDMVYVRGDFNEFSLDNPMVLVGDDIYQAVIEVEGPAGSDQEFKFFIEAGDERELPNGGWELFVENPDDNRVFMLGEPDVDQALLLVFFNDDEGASEPEFVTVWPGDANNDGVVNEEDVLPLAIYWNQTGPARENASVEWTGQQAEVWSPVAATFADTDGSGLINQTDLLAIGLNFGETHGDAVFNADPVNSANISSLNTGDRATITISASQTTALQGISFAFEAEGVEDEFFTISELEMGEWAQSWKESGSMIEFNRAEGPQLSGARAHKGLTNPESADELLSFVIEATQNWNSEAQLLINRMSYINAEGEAISFEEILIDIDIQTGTSIGDTELPRQTALNQNYPNPFNPTTNIAFDLSENSVVTIEVVNVLGQRVAMLANRQEMSAGSHVQTFDASRLTSGVYLVRMTAGSQTFTRKMMLVK